MASETDRLRRELARAGGVAVGSRVDEHHDELVAVVRVGADLSLRGGAGPRLALTVRNRVAAVPRRVRELAAGEVGAHGALVAHEGDHLDRRRYGVEFVGADAVAVAALAGLADGDGRLRARPDWPVAALRPTAARSRLAGALLAAGTLRSGRDPRLELQLRREVDAEQLAGDAALLDAPARRADRAAGPRLLWRSRTTILALVHALGAVDLAVELEEQARRTALRAATVRVRNADDANLDRSLSAAARQVAAVEHALTVLDVDELPPDLREAALARLVNPSVPLSDLGELLDPPRSRSAVLRRLQRLEALAAQAGGVDGDVDGHGDH